MSEINSIAQTIDTISKEWNLSGKITNHINLAIEEVVSNILFYAYDDKEEHLINIELCCLQNHISISIIDDGKNFNLLDAAKQVDTYASIEERKVGGLGIHLLKTIMDNIEYQRDGNKNILKLTKYF